MMAQQLWRLAMRIFILGSVFVFVLFILPIQAQDMSKAWHTTREDFLAALGLQPKDPLIIVPNTYATLVQYPTARSPITFAFDSSAVSAESQAILDNLADVLTHELSNATIVIAGHTDNTGANVYNLALSQRRAQTVQNYLVSVYNITSTRLIIRWFGEDEPYTSNATKTGRAQNRRVEFFRIR